MNVHHFDYLPFLLQPGLSDGILERWFTREEKFQLACQRHRWLYGRIRKDIVERTVLADKTPDYQAVWLGDVSDWEHPDTWRMGLGVNVDAQQEKFWFSYARLRDGVAMIRELMNLNNPSTLNGVPEIFLDVPPAVLGAGVEGTAPICSASTHTATRQCSSLSNRGLPWREMATTSWCVLSRRCATMPVATKRS